MLFNSTVFLIFLPTVFLLYWFVFNKNLKWQNIFLLAISYFFYGWWDWRFLSLIAISSIADYGIGLMMDKTEAKRQRKLLLGMSLLVNLGFLGFFKYFNFFLGSFVDIMDVMGLQPHVSTLKIILPVGISFYTFQTLSYTIDIYRKQLKPTKDFISFMAFVSFFPQLVAGPIERAKNLLPYFHRPRQFDYNNAVLGLKIILWGFFKKVVIADRAAVIVDSVYNSPGDYQGFPMFVASVFFAIQIYCDFSGYSDIAIGTSKLFGFELMENFKRPYYSKSITEFWRRWHISLSTWFRDYVYIPLGGNKVSKARHLSNLFITFLVSGLWHGANWTFVIWGAYHGALIIIERLVKKKMPGLKKIIPGGWAGKIFYVILTNILVCIGWVFFRADNVHDAVYILAYMFSDIADYTDLGTMALKFRGMGVKGADLALTFGLVLVMEVYHFIERKGDVWEQLASKPMYIRWAIYYLLLAGVLFLGTNNGAQNFIYFQF